MSDFQILRLTPPRPGASKYTSGDFVSRTALTTRPSDAGKYTVTGKDTYQHRQTFKEMGGKWNKDMKSWIFDAEKEPDLRSWHLKTIGKDREKDLIDFRKEAANKTEPSTVPANDTNVGSLVQQLLMVVGELKNEIKDLREEVRSLYHEDESDSDSDSSDEEE